VGSEPSETREDLLRKSVVSLAHGQEFDGALICKLQYELAHLRRENARLREALNFQELESLSRENARLRAILERLSC